MNDNIYLTFDDPSHYSAHKKDFIDYENTFRELQYRFAQEGLDFDKLGIQFPKNKRPQGRKIILYEDEVFGYKGLYETSDKDEVTWGYRIGRVIPSRIVLNRGKEETRGIVIIAKPSKDNPNTHWTIQTFYPGGKENLETQREPFSLYQQYLRQGHDKFFKHNRTQTLRIFYFWTYNALRLDEGNFQELNYGNRKTIEESLQAYDIESLFSKDHRRRKPFGSEY